MLLFYKNLRDTSVDDPTPVITSASGVSTPEGDLTFTYTLTTDIEVESFRFDGGPDDAKFSLTDSAVTWASGFTPDYEIPADADTNNTYVAYFKAYALNSTTTSARFILTVTVTDVGEVTVGVGSFDAPSAPSESEILISNPAATGADSFEYEINGDGNWVALV